MNPYSRKYLCRGGFLSAILSFPRSYAPSPAALHGNNHRQAQLRVPAQRQRGKQRLRLPPMSER